MVSFRPATADEAQRWLGSWRQRLDDWYAGRGAVGMSKRVSGWESDPGDLIAILTDQGHVAGFLAVALRDGSALVTDLWVEPATRGQGYGRAAFRHAQEWAASHEAARFGVVVSTDDPAALAMARELPLRAQKMVKRLDNPQLPAGVTMRPMVEAEYDAWLDAEVPGYAHDIAQAGLATPEEALQISEKEYREIVPDRLATPGYTWWCIDTEEHRMVASIWLKPHYSPALSWVFSVETKPEHRGHGYGRAAMLAGERATLEAGDTHLGLNVFGNNEVALRLYDSLEYTVVEQFRST
jgi:mycothiol synthase